MKGFEIERKFLVKVDEHGIPIIDLKLDMLLHGFSKIETISQCFLSTDPDKVIRIRLVKEDVSDKGWFYRLKHWLRVNKSAWNVERWDQALLTVKGKSDGPKRREIETELDLKTAIDLCQHFSLGTIRKMRFTTIIGKDVWQIDSIGFLNGPRRLIVAEIELEHADQTVDLPTWVGQEVTEDHRYSNVNLSQTGWPFHE